MLILIVVSPRLPQLKSYFKILSILYFVDDTNLPITLDIIETVVKSTHIFNNIVLVSHSQVIKTFPKSNIVMVQIDIWNSQTNTTVKSLISRYFNIGQHITTIRGTNMNLDVSQCKNC